MELSVYFKSIIDQDDAMIVICDLNHAIIYMNPKAIQKHEKRGNLIGRNLMDCHNEHSQKMILAIVQKFQNDENCNKIFTGHREKYNRDVYMVALRDENKKLIGYYEKHEDRTPENQKPFEIS